MGMGLAALQCTSSSRAAARCGEAELAEGTIERLATLAGVGDGDWALGLLARSRAFVADDATAEGLYVEACDRLSRAAAPPELARSLLVYGEWLRRVKRRVDTRSQLRSAHEMFVAMGIRAFAERARRELLATGRRCASALRIPRRAHPQEAHIARLAADGLTNPEIGTQLFISPRTVEWHMKKVFTKLGISSRHELRDVLPRRERLTATE